MKTTIKMPKSPSQHKLSVELPSTLVDRIDTLAARELITRTAWVRRVILDALRAAGLTEKPVPFASAYEAEMARVFGGRGA